MDKLMLRTVLLTIAMTLSTFAQERGRFSISFSLSTRQIVLHEPLFIEFTVENTGTKEVELDLGKDRKEAFQFVLIRPDGSDVNLRPLTREGIGDAGNVKIAAGEKYQQQVLFNEWYQFSAVGLYEIQVKLNRPIRGLVASAVRDPARLKIEVLPRDEQRLTQTCLALSNRIESSSTFAEAATAALALSYVNDTVAVPYLERSIGSTQNVDNILVRGLERIGDDAAVHALIRINESRNGETVLMTRNVLKRLESKTQDPVVRALITNALDK